MPRPPAMVAGLGLLGVALALLAPLAVPGAAAVAVAQVGPGGRISLASQTPWTEPGGTFELRVDLSEVRRPEDLALVVRVHEAVTSRSQFRRTLDGRLLGEELWRAGPTPLADLELDAAGTVPLTIPVAAPSGVGPRGRAGAGALLLGRAGVHPVQVELHDRASGEVLDRFTTHLVRSRDDGAPPLAVAWVQAVGAPPALQPDASVVLDDSDRAALASTAAALQDDVPLTVVPRPETLDALASLEPRILDQLADVPAGRQVVASPYVDIDTEALLGAGLAEVVDAQRAQGASVVEHHLGRVDRRTWVSDVPVDPVALASAGAVEQVVLPEATLAPLDRSLTLANPFLVEDARGRRVEAAAVDPELQAHFERNEDPVLGAHHLLADLAVLSYDSPGRERGVVVQPPPGWVPDGDLLATLLGALSSGSVVRAVTLDELFDQVPPARSVDGEVELVRSLAPRPAPLVPHAGSLRQARAELASFATVVGPASSAVELAQRLVLVSLATSLPDPRRAAYLEGAHEVVGERLGAIGILSGGSFRMTSREATIPLTLVSDLDAGVDVALVLESDKLDFVGPGPTATGRTTIPLRLGPGRTPVMVPVEARTSGDFPLRIELRSPDGRLAMATTRLTVRSTSLSGVGILVSAGAGLFLCTWWARHWRHVRRDRRLVATSATPDAP